MHLGLHHLSELLALLVAIGCFKKLWGSFMFGFIPFLFTILALELFENYVHHQYNISTLWLINIQVFGILLFNAFIFMRFATSIKIIKTIKFITVVAAVAWVVYYLVLFRLFTFNNFFYGFMFMVQIVFGLFYFYDVLLNDNMDASKNIYAGLWIAAGVVIFNAGVSICFLLYDFIKANELKIDSKYLYNIIPRYLSVIQYTCISVALLLWKKQAK